MMPALLLAIAFYGTLADARFNHVDAANGTIVGSAMRELDNTEASVDAGETHLTEKDVDDIIFFIVNSENYAGSKAAEEALEKRNPELMKKLKNFERDVNGTVKKHSQASRLYVLLK